MRQITVATFTSLDGIMWAPGGPQEDTTGNFTLGAAGPSPTPSMLTTRLAENAVSLSLDRHWSVVLGTTPGT